MKTGNVNEMSLIRSRSLAAVFSLILSALLLFPLISSASGEVEVESTGVVYMQPLKAKPYAAVTLADFAEGKYSMTIESINESEVYYGASVKGEEGFSKVFDLSRLDDGLYTLKVESRSTKKERVFSIKDGKIDVKYHENDVPEFKTIGSKAVVLFPNTLNKNVTISVYTAKGEKLYDMVNVQENIRKVFDFSKVETGNYKIVINANNKEYAYNFQK